MASARRIAVSMAVTVGVCMVFVSSVFVAFIIIHLIDYCK
jgi:hypothetical protein